MEVKLISYSQPVAELVEQGINDAQELIAFCARVSNPSNQYNTETSDRLIKYLIKHRHWSPLEMTSACIEISTTRDIGRQILRHRSFSFQEFCLSGDTEIYFGIPVKISNDFYKPTRKIKISELFDKWHNGAAPIPSRWDSGEPIRIPMKDRIQNMFLKCYDEESGKLTTTHIKDIFYTGKKELYKITLSDGKEIKTTKEHKFLTEHGFDTLENVIGLEWRSNFPVMTKKAVVGVNGVPVYQDKNWLEEKKKESLFPGGGLPYLVEKYGVNYHTLRKWLKKHDLTYTKQEVNIITDGPWNKGVFGYKTKEKSEETRRKHQISAKKGAECNLWRGGGSKKRKGIDSVDAVSFRREKNHTCERCGVYGGTTDIHHIIPVSENPMLENERSNWELLCRDCHIEHHKNNGYPGWQAMGVKSKKQNSYTVKWCTIDKIEYVGEEDTYDIEVEHSSHNYIANGIVVHNSQRYSDPVKELSFTYREARLQDNKNRQNSIHLDLENADHRELAKEWLFRQQEVIRLCKSTYEWAVNNGLAKEVARAVLPEGLTDSKLYLNGTLRSFLHFIEVRTDVSTQLEHRLVARAVAEAISAIFPMVTDFVDNS